MKSIHTSSLLCTSSKAAHDVSFDESSKDERAASLPVQYVLSSSIYFYMLPFVPSFNFFSFYKLSFSNLQIQ